MTDSALLEMQRLHKSAGLPGLGPSQLPTASGLALQVCESQSSDEGKNGCDWGKLAEHLSCVSAEALLRV